MTERSENSMIFLRKVWLNEWPFLLTIPVLLGVYAPSFLADYAKIDTLMVFSNVYYDRFHPWMSWLSVQGRPLTSFATHLLMSRAEGLSDLQWVRFVGFIGTLALAFSLDHVLKRRSIAPVFRFLLVPMICTVPGVAVYNIWTVCFCYSWGAALAVYGGQLCCEGEPEGKVITVRRILGMIVVFTSLWIYQPSALFGLIPMVLAIQYSESRFPVLLRGLTIRLGAIVLTLGAYVLSYKYIFLNLMPGVNAGLRSRLEHASDTVGQIKIVLTRAIPETFEGWAYFFGPATTKFIVVASFLILLAGLISIISRLKTIEGLVKVTFLVACLVLSLIPILYLSTGVPYFRIMAPFAAIVVLLIAGSCMQIPGRKMRHGKVYLLGALAGLQIFGAAYVVRNVWVGPSHRELILFREHISGIPEESMNNVIIVPSRKWVFGSRYNRYLFGFLSTNQGWIMDPMVRLLVSEQYGKNKGLYLPLLSASGPVDLPYVTIIDANEVIWGESLPEIAPSKSVEGFGNLYALRQGGIEWWGSKWFGVFRHMEKEGSIRHFGLGDVDFKWEGSVLQLKTSENGWVETDRNRFPEGTKKGGVVVNLLEQ